MTESDISCVPLPWGPAASLQSNQTVFLCVRAGRWTEPHGEPAALLCWKGVMSALLITVLELAFYRI